MSQPQAGIIPEPNQNALFLVLRVKDPDTNGRVVAQVDEHGLFFIAYTNNLDIPEKMLHRMLGTSGDGQYDHLMDFSQAVSGAHFFAPSLDVLTKLGT